MAWVQLCVSGAREDLGLKTTFGHPLTTSNMGHDLSLLAIVNASQRFIAACGE